MISFQDIISLAEEVVRTPDFVLSWYAFFVFVLGLGLSSLIELVIGPVIRFLLPRSAFRPLAPLPAHEKRPPRTSTLKAHLSGCASRGRIR